MAHTKGNGMGANIRKAWDLGHQNIPGNLKKSFEGFPGHGLVEVHKKGGK